MKEYLKQVGSMKNFPLVTLVLAIVTILVILSIIQPNVTMVIFSIVAFILIEVVDRAQPQRIPSFLSWWDNLPLIVHVGILLVIAWFAISLLYLIFTKNLKEMFKVIFTTSRPIPEEG